MRVWDGTAAGAGGGGKCKDAPALPELLSIKHDNNTGRWVLPFR